MGTAKRAALADDDFEPENIDLDAITNAEVLNPGMVAFRVAVVTLNKTKSELIAAVHAMDADDTLDDMVKLLVDADEMFEIIHATCAEAERRIGVCRTMRPRLHDGAKRHDGHG